MNDKELKILIEKSKNWGEIVNPDGTRTIKMKLSFEGSVDNAIRSQGVDAWGIKEAMRFYYEGREAWLKGDLETVADLFGILV
jgi:hypothetical protein